MKSNALHSYYFSLSRQVRLLLPLLLFAITVNAQDTAIQARMILMGGAGKATLAQQIILSDAASKVIKDKTTVLFLGNNIAPDGMTLKENKAADEAILRAQYAPMRNAGAAVYFLPGNYDWDRSGPDGLQKIKTANDFLQSQNDSLLQMAPHNGCPGPEVINVSDSLVIIALDTEWWLYAYSKDNPEAECNCSSTREVINSLQEVLYRNRYKTILLATHHPFLSYGNYGGRFSLKDNLFPLTAVNKSLYLPLPLVGSLYPLGKKILVGPEDLHHPLYQQMIKDIDGVFKGFPNLVHISAHEKDLQLINNKANGIFQIISGSASEAGYTGHGSGLLYGKSANGYVVADLLYNNNIRFTFYIAEDEEVKQDYTYIWQHTDYHPVESAAFKAISGDNTIAAAHSDYQRQTWLGNFVFGKNYRKEWARPVKLPVLRLSELKGGLVPEQLGGGFQSTSLRVKDSAGREYTFRTVEKKPDLVVPAPFRGTFVRELLDDATSAQHPYSALIVPPVATALGVPHATPIVGVIAPDKNIGQYQQLFDGKVVLFEAREPLGDSKNFVKTIKDLHKDNDNSYDARNFLRARMMDLLFADWDRHGDQWRFYNENKKGEPDYFIAIPRDRDMVLNITQGFLPTIVKRLFVMPHVFGFNDKAVNSAKWYLYKSSFLDAFPASQLSYNAWMQEAESFKKLVTDSVLELSLSKLPPEIGSLRHDKILHDLQARRDAMPKAISRFYRLRDKIVDIRTSNKNEFISVSDSAEGLYVLIRKINKHGALEDTLVSKLYPDAITKEIRLYSSKGDDSTVVNKYASRIKLRLIGGKGHKAYNIIHTNKRINLYDRKEEHYYGEANKLNKHINDDSVQTAFVPVNLYDTYLPQVTAAINRDDGLLLGAGLQYTRQKGFRKSPYSSRHTIMLSHSFSTQAFNIKYKSEWLDALGHADLLAAADIKAPDNTQNFFGMGNESPLNKNGDYKTYYRTRFNTIDLAIAARWRYGRGSTFSIGPAYQYYWFDKDDNTGRFINQTTQLHSYDSLIISNPKQHLGFIANYESDKRDNKLLPATGTYLNLTLQGFAGLNRYSGDYLQFTPEFNFYKNLNHKQTVILADRMGAGLTIGHAGFYQSLYLGGQENLYGYRKYRFAGQGIFYNNTELRIIIADFGNYILKGQLGLLALYDVGRVWQDGEHSDKWHNGAGCGIYIAPASLAVFRFTMSYSSEGWFPNFAMGFRF